MYTSIEVKTNASRLRNILAELGHELKHSRCLDVISKVEGYPDWNNHTAELNRNQQRAEQFLDELLAAKVEHSYSIFTQRFEKKYLVNFTETMFLRDVRSLDEELGNYIRREFMGCVAAHKRPDDDRYRNQVRYVWRGFFDNHEVLITLGIYKKGDTYYLCEAMYR